MEVLKMKDGKKCILIADDEKDIRDVLYLLLSDRTGKNRHAPSRTHSLEPRRFYE